MKTKLLISTVILCLETVMSFAQKSEPTWHGAEAGIGWKEAPTNFMIGKPRRCYISRTTTEPECIRSNESWIIHP